MAAGMGREGRPVEVPPNLPELQQMFRAFNWKNVASGRWRR